VFRSCTSLTTITVATNNPNYSSEDGILYNKTKTEIVAYPSASGNVTIPSSVTTIGIGAFKGCDDLIGITIPGVTSIGDGAFSWCASLTNITIPSGVMSIDYQAFANCTSLASITIPSSVTSIGEQAFINCTSLASITIPAGVMSVGSQAFNGWIPSQTIYVQGYDYWWLADDAWGWEWRNGCNAQIVF
jgi:hypothetical protein